MKEAMKQQITKSRSNYLDETVSSKDLALQYTIKGLLAGPSGSGKSTAATTLPGRKLFIDYDGRKETLLDYPDVEVLDCYDPDAQSPKAWDKAEKIRKEIWSQVRKGTFPYDAVIEDGLTRMLRIGMNWALLLDPKRGLGGSPAKHHYMPQMTNVSNHILSLLSLPLHYILTAHIEYIEVEEEGGFKILPKATGKMRTEIPGWFNETYFCFHDRDKEGEKRYYFNTSGTQRWDFLKSTINQRGKFWKDPVEIDLDKDPAGFALLLSMRGILKGKETKDD